MNPVRLQKTTNIYYYVETGTEFQMLTLLLKLSGV